MEKRCLPITIVTPKKYLLDGLWFGGNRPRRAIVYVHGRDSAVFAGQDFFVLSHPRTRRSSFSTIAAMTK